MGRTAAPYTMRSVDDVREALLRVAETVTGGAPYLLLATPPARTTRRRWLPADPSRSPVSRWSARCSRACATYPSTASPWGFRAWGTTGSAATSCSTPRWELSPHPAAPYRGPTVVVAGRLDSTVGYAAAVDLAGDMPRASLAVLDDAGHALPHEQPDLLRALLAEWLTRVDRPARPTAP